MEVMAIDPGVSRCGVALLDEEGRLLAKATIGMDPHSDQDEKVADAQRQLRRLIEEWGRPDVLVMEAYAVYGLKGSVVNGFMMGRIIQALIDEARFAVGEQLRLETVPAREVRRFVCGNASASASQMKQGLALMGYRGRSNPHERDALALALCWLEKEKERER